MSVFLFDRFDDLSKWTKDETNGTVVVANNKVTITGDTGGVVDTLGMWHTLGFTYNANYIVQFDYSISDVSTTYAVHVGLHSTTGLDNNNIVGGRMTTSGPTSPGTSKQIGIDNDAGSGEIGTSQDPLLALTTYTCKILVNADGTIRPHLDGGGFDNASNGNSVTATFSGTLNYFDFQIINFSSTDDNMVISEFFIHNNGLNFDHLSWVPPGGGSGMKNIRQKRDRYYNPRR